MPNDAMNTTTPVNHSSDIKKVGSHQNTDTDEFIEPAQKTGSARDTGPSAPKETSDRPKNSSAHPDNTTKLNQSKGNDEAGLKSSLNATANLTDSQQNRFNAEKDSESKKDKDEVWIFRPNPESSHQREISNETSKENKEDATKVKKENTTKEDNEISTEESKEKSTEQGKEKSAETENKSLENKSSSQQSEKPDSHAQTPSAKESVNSPKPETLLSKLGTTVGKSSFFICYGWLSNLIKTTGIPL